LLKLKSEGKVRAVGLSSHGLSALRFVLKNPEIDLVWARINFAGIYMDAYSLGLYDRLSTIPCLKKITKLIPHKIKAVISSTPESQVLSSINRREVEDTLRQIHSQLKGFVGMEVLIEGYLRKDIKRAVEYVRNLPFVDAFIIGMMNKKEVEENCRIISSIG
jgi:aryl-alcohol dehydrogenase-like predicted oxidoreductase